MQLSPAPHQHRRDRRRLRACGGARRSGGLRRAIAVTALGLVASLGLLSASAAAPTAGALAVFDRVTPLPVIGRAPKPAQPEPTAPMAFDPSALCDIAIARAAKAHGVPERLLRSVALVESGRTRDGELKPWPWTVNMEGEGRWFDTRDAALAFVRERQAKGARSFDLGCLQLNHYWHGDGFESLEAMIEPNANADYAARFLSGLKAETGDWMRAAGYYHSRNPKPFARYSAKIAKVFDSAAAQRAASPEMLAAAPAPRDDRTAPAPRPADRDAARDAESPGPRYRGLLRLATLPLAAPARPRPASSQASPSTAAVSTAAPSAGGLGLGALVNGRRPDGPLLTAPPRPFFAPRAAPSAAPAPEPQP